MSDTNQPDRPLTLPELLAEAHEALIEFMHHQTVTTGHEWVEDAAQFVYDALAMVDPGIADDVAKTRAAMSTDGEGTNDGR